MTRQNGPRRDDRTSSARGGLPNFAVDWMLERCCFCRQTIELDEDWTKRGDVMMHWRCGPRSPTTTSNASYEAVIWRAGALWMDRATPTCSWR